MIEETGAQVMARLEAESDLRSGSDHELKVTGRMVREGRAVTDSGSVPSEMDC